MQNVGGVKPFTIDDEDSATLAQWLYCYPELLHKPSLLRGLGFTLAAPAPAVLASEGDKHRAIVDALQAVGAGVSEGTLHTPHGVVSHPLVVQVAARARGGKAA